MNEGTATRYGTVGLLLQMTLKGCRPELGTGKSDQKRRGELEKRASDGKSLGRYGEENDHRKLLQELAIKT